MKIAICEDQAPERDALRGLLEAELDQRRIVCEIVSFQSGEAMLAALQHEVFPVSFLDIYMPGITGVDVAREIRRRDEGAVIIFTTTSPDHMAEGFDLGAVHYILKPVTVEAMRQAMDRALRLVQDHGRYVEIQIDRVRHKLYLADILAVESKDKYCAITTKANTLYPYMRLDELEALLGDERFLRCHRSYLVNMDFAMGVRDNDFVLTSGLRVPIKRERRQEMKHRFQAYCVDKLRRGME